MILIQNEQSLMPYLPRSIRLRGKRVLKKIGLEHVDVSVLLCNDYMIHKLNNDWRKVDKKTDVLSFPLFSNLNKYKEKDLALKALSTDCSISLGDIVISVETCIEQAIELSHTPYDEAIRLWIHGLLHLCGYDHIQIKDAHEMKKKEELLLSLFKTRRIKPLVQKQGA